MVRTFLILIITVFLQSCTGNRQAVLSSDPGLKIPFNPEKYLCLKTTKPIFVDGDLNDPAWEDAPWSKAFVDIEGMLKPLPALDTRVKMLWDDTYFYIAAELIEPHIWATFTKHDTVIYLNDNFEVFIDPDGDSHQYMEYEINAFGTDWDLLLTKPYRDGGLPIDSWEIPGLLKGVKIYGSINDPADEDEKWTVELAFPWEILREYNTRQKKPDPGDQWRINFSRVDWHMLVENGKYVKKKDEHGSRLPENNWVWSPQGVIAMHQPETWGYVQFVENIADTFIEKSDEQVKWALRQLYYREQAYFTEYRKFSSSKTSLGLHEVMLESKSFEPEIMLLPSGFIASYPSFDKDGVWYIQADGLIQFKKNQ